MKKTDIAMIILIGSLSMAVAYFSAGSIPGLKTTGSIEKVGKMQKIDPSIGEINKSVFSDDAVNPTVPVTIGAGEAPNQPEER